MIPFDLHSLLTRLADREAVRSEADVQSDVRALLLFGGLQLDEPQVRLESPAPNRRRIDVEIGSCVIECKKDLRLGNVLAEGTEQLGSYMADRTAELGRRYVGILTDGAEWHLFQLVGNEPRPVYTRYLNRSQPDIDGIVVWLETILNTVDQIKPTPSEIRERLGATSAQYLLDLGELGEIYGQLARESEVANKRGLWAQLLTATFGSGFHDDDRLFIEHTYLVMIAEIVAHVVVGIDVLDPNLTAASLLSGETFGRSGIAGVVEADFFDWPAASEQGQRFVLATTRRVARFNWSEVEHDVLKVLYESVIDAPTRHRLGEYYTPDWLADRIVHDVVDNPLGQRVLDPACGSGTFLFWTVQLYMRAAAEAGIHDSDAISGVVSHVFGIDLHPVAVTLARVTYLLAIGTDRLRASAHRPFAIPVYLGDAVQFEQQTSVLAPEGVTITTAPAELFERTLHFPEAVVADGDSFDRLVSELAARSVSRERGSPVPRIKRILDRYAVSEADRDSVEASFRVLCELHDLHRNHIWGYYIRNLARPIWFARSDNRVDLIMGNPPWLRYNAMTERMGQNFQALCRARKLWAGASVATSQDLSALFVTRSIELYLRLGGRFGFVMPAAVLSRPQYAGFRTGRLSDSRSDEIRIAFDQPYDLTGVDPDPFPVPAGVIFGTRVSEGAAVELPADRQIWSGALPTRDASWDEAAPHFEVSRGATSVVDPDLLSAYAESARQGANLVPRLLLSVEERPAPQLGVTGGQVPIISRRVAAEREPWRSLPAVTGLVERQFLYRFHLGETVVPYRFLDPLTTVLPFASERLLGENDDNLDRYPGLAEWWRTVNSLWMTHRQAATTMSLVEQIDYQGKLIAQLPAPPIRVVYTGRGSRVAAAWTDHPELIIDHALYWLTAGSADEARYLIGFLNSSTLHSRVESYFSRGQFGARNIHRAPFMVGIPIYDPDNNSHREIAATSTAIEELVAAMPFDRPGAIGSARSRVRAAIGASDEGMHLEALVQGLLGS
jgi:SAM-dependent methyltransferase